MRLLTSQGEEMKDVMTDLLREEVQIAKKKDELDGDLR